MRKSRVITILCLSLILCFVCATTSTFSWFNRTDESGKSLALNDNVYSKTSGKSYKYTTSVLTGTDYEALSEDNAIGSTTIASGQRACYKTEIKSNNESSQNISLYLSGFKSTDGTKLSSTYLGVNGPMKTYKRVSDYVGSNNQKTESNINKRNVYVGIQRGGSFVPTNYYLHWWNTSGSSGDIQVNYLHYEDKTFNNVSYNIYHATVPYEAKKVKPFVKENGGDNYGTNQQEHSLSNIDFVGIYRLNGGSITGSTSGSIGTPAGIKTFYSKATVEAGGTIDLQAVGQGTMSYTSSDDDVTVDSNGKVTASADITQKKEVTITVTSTGEVCDDKSGRKPDTQTATCKLTVYPASRTDGKLNVPVVTNVKISKYDTETNQNLVTVYWYIKNESKDNITFSIDKVDVTL